MLREKIRQVLNDEVSDTALRQNLERRIIEENAQHFASNYVYLIGEFEGHGRRIKDAGTGQFVKIDKVLAYLK